MSGIISYTTLGGKSGVIGPVPSFRAYTTGSATALPAGNQTTVVFGATNHNIGGHFDTSTSNPEGRTQFTAPISGSYFLSSRILLQTTTTLHRMIIYIHQNSAEFAGGQSVHGSSAHGTVGTSTVMYMLAGDKAWISVVSADEGGSIYVASAWAYFSGFLIG